MHVGHMDRRCLACLMSSADLICHGRCTRQPALEALETQHLRNALDLDARNCEGVGCHTHMLNKPHAGVGTQRRCWVQGITLNMEASCESSYAGRARTQMNTSWAELLLQAILGLAANSMAID